MRAFLAVVVALAALWACSRPAKERPADMLGTAARALADGGTGLSPVVELAFSDAGVLTGLWLTVSEDAPEGVHLGLSLLDAGGRALATERSVVACVALAHRDERVFIPVAAGDDEGTATLAAARSLRVTFARRAPGCLRPTLRVEAMARPAEAH